MCALDNPEQHLNGLTVMHQSGDNDTVVLESECQVPVQKVRVKLFFLTNIGGFKIEYRNGMEVF